jgi:hypothetical protein
MAQSAAIKTDIQYWQKPFLISFFSSVSIVLKKTITPTP